MSTVTDFDAQVATQHSISPTDVSQFIRLEQCQRYLRLRLHERAHGLGFMRDNGMDPQNMPTSLSRSGELFETLIEGDIAAAHAWHRFDDADRQQRGERDDNQNVVTLLNDLTPASTMVLGQPRLRAQVGSWHLVGVVDLIRVERTADGALRITIADMKSSSAPRVEHRLQVAFYQVMLANLLAEAGVAHDPIQLAVLYRGPVSEPAFPLPAKDQETLERHRAAALEQFRTAHGYLDIVPNPDAFIASAHDLVLGEDSQAARIVATPAADIPFHLTSKCDGCLYNEFCMRRASETDDLSLIPHITEGDKTALIRGGITTTRDLATLKDLAEPTPGNSRSSRLVPAEGRSAQARKLSTTWPVGGRIDELIHRARRYRSFKGDRMAFAYDIPGSGQSSLPFSSADHNPNLVRVFIDAQQDYLNERVYLLGSLVVCNEHGTPAATRRRSVVKLTPEAPTTAAIEQDLLVGWVRETLEAIVELAAPDADGEPRAPIHLVFVNGIAQKALLDALGRHATSVFGVTALYEFVTQLAAFTSPIGTHLESQIRNHRNYPMVCQSLQSVAAFLKFDWNAPEPYREAFKSRLFDFWGKHDAPPEQSPGISQWYTNRARFNSQIPLEYALAAWGQLPNQPLDEEEDPGTYAAITPELLTGFEARRLEAMEWVADDMRGNDLTELSAFSLPDLAAFTDRALTMAAALEEFATIEQHVELAAWKNDHLADPETRALRGQTLILRYDEADQLPGIAERNRDNQARLELDNHLIASLKAADPKATRRRYTAEQKAATAWSQDDMVYRLRVDTSDLACELDELLRLTTIKPDGRYIIYERHAVDSRKPREEREAFNATSKQLLYGMRANLLRMEIIRDDEHRAIEAFAHVTLTSSFRSSNNGFSYPTNTNRPLAPGELLTLDTDPGNWMGDWAVNVSKGLAQGGSNRLYDLLLTDTPLPVERHDAFAAGQQRFLNGLNALVQAGALHPFEDEQSEYILRHAETPILLVQGPPGTGKSFSTAYALLARLQGAMAAGITYRVFLSCKTHSATDGLLHHVRAAQHKLRELAHQHADLVAQYIDERLLTFPLFRYRPAIDHQPGIVPLPQDKFREPGTPKAVERIEATSWSVVAGTPGGIYSLVKDQWPKDLFGHHLVQCLVLDEASQMSLPEAIMAALPLAANGQLIVVGDHRQMPPIVKNDWNNEPRRTFQDFRTYESLFVTLLERDTPIIRFARSFRLHADMAEFLRQEIYVHDGIRYHSTRHDLIDRHDFGDGFLAAALNPEHPLTVIVHEESGSQVLNEFEQQVIAPILAALADPSIFDLRPSDGFGVVVPHRAQRAAFQEAAPDLNMYDEEGNLLVSAVDTVERFQGDERTVMLIGATESDRDYLLVSGKFLLDPRRLTVALSRAKRKMILVAARSVFEVFSTDEETFANAQLWKNLLRKTCTELLWEGDRHGTGVQVWGNPTGTNTATPHHPADT